MSLYRHNEQSLRVVERIENGGKGLNLTPEVRDGIVCHTGEVRAETLEGRIVATADRIAYVNHDIDDAIRAGILSERDLPDSTHTVLGPDHSSRIETVSYTHLAGVAKTFEVTKPAGVEAFDFTSEIFNLGDQTGGNTYGADLILTFVPSKVDAGSAPSAEAGSADGAGVKSPKTGQGAGTAAGTSAVLLTGAGAAALALRRKIRG